jgi:hypothetical protein
MHPGHDSLPPWLRAQLLASGIPGAKQNHEGLCGLFPHKFNVAAAGLSEADLARVLLHLTAEGIITVAPDGAGSSLKAVEPGWHFCQFYRDFDQLLELVAPYIAEGLHNGEGCLWVMPEAVSINAASQALSRHVAGLERYRASGQLELLQHPDWYLDAAGQLKSFEQIAQQLLGRQDKALASGFKFLRAAGDAGWVSGSAESHAFIDYEIKVNAALKATKVAAICTYRADATADELIRIVAAHQDAFV